MEKMRLIIHKFGFVPGKRTFHTALWREYSLNVSVKHCQKLMKKMNLVAARPLKDAYKHQATHNHECAAPANLVQQNFYIGPRKVILTDITYLYYGPNRTTAYLCVFKDAYTREILGHAFHTKMDTDLVKAAYDDMMEHHKDELKKSQVYIHSDQGSQYTSTTFAQILKDDGFLQSVSGRGNSQDNAPMESFFARMKTHILNLAALCPDFKTSEKLVNGYISSYNSEQYQYQLAGLTPKEFYIYVTEGIYPLDNYYGVKADELRTINDLVNDRLKRKQEERDKRREAARKKSEARSMLNKSPLQIIARDQKLVRSQLKQWKDAHELSEKQISHLEELLKKIASAGDYILTLTDAQKEELKDPQNWKKHEQLSYVFEMNDLF